MEAVDLAAAEDPFEDSEKGPERTCVVTRRKAAPDEMIRFVVGPDGGVVPDIRQKLPGRGVWVTASAAKVTEAVARQAFARGFKKKVAVSPTLAVEVEALLTRDCLQSLAIANKAGQVIAGFGKVEEAIAGGAIEGVIHACDGGEDGARKLAQCLRRRFGDENVRPLIELFRSDQLDLALGRSNVVHAALLTGSASAAALVRCRRLAMYRQEFPVSRQGPGQGRGPEAEAD
ncbi:RNA-binding protein [Methylocella silvestris]|uniref:DNA-binding protein n=1 Tax=Methylocella silvestris TaxID=199596 RepID=A0A2J7TG85_METSI|nr:RNA-binding protein [Methylocella silvestris]PNG25784.1 DNA-binding protein [Methylocella silvestris]